MGLFRLLSIKVSGGKGRRGSDRQAGLETCDTADRTVGATVIRLFFWDSRPPLSTVLKNDLESERGSDRLRLYGVSPDVALHQ